MAYVVGNFVETTLGAICLVGAAELELSIVPANFPTIGGMSGNTALLVLEQGSRTSPTKREIVLATARAGTTVSITRAQDGTTAQEFAAGDRVVLRLVRALWEQVAADAAAASAAVTAISGLDLLVRTATGTLSAERVVTDTASITWDWGTAGQAKANVANAGLLSTIMRAAVGMRSSVATPGASTMDELGLDTAVSGSATPTYADTNVQTRAVRHESTISSGGTAVVNGWFPNAETGKRFYRADGFYFSCIFGFVTIGSAPAIAWMCGLTNISTASQNPLSTAAVPSNHTDMVVFGRDEGDANIQLMTNDASGVATKVDLGVAPATDTLYFAEFWCTPAGNIRYRLFNMGTVAAVASGTATTDLPTAGTGMKHCFVSRTATAGITTRLACTGFWVNFNSENIGGTLA